MTKPVKLEGYIQDDTEFEFGKEGARWFVSCWKGKDFEDCHWYLYFGKETDARKEFERWRK